MQKKYKISIKVKKCETVFDDRFEPGVIGFIEVIYTVLSNNKFDSPLFAAQLDKSGQELIEKLIEIKYEEIK